MAAGVSFTSFVSFLFPLLLIGPRRGYAFQPSLPHRRRRQVFRRYASFQRDSLSSPSSFKKKKRKPKRLVDLQKSTSKDDNKDNAVIVPCVPSLDACGPLPSEAYRITGNPEFDAKPTCLVSVAVDLRGAITNSDADDPRDIVRSMQNFIDSGFTTFHLGLPPPTLPRRIQQQRETDLMEELLCPSALQTWGEEEIFGRLIRTTPGFALRTCHLVVPLRTPSAQSRPVTRSLVRQAVTESLQRIGTDSIDTLQLQYCQGSPYHLDMLEYLMDFQRDGLIKSISGRNMPVQVQTMAKNSGLAMDSNQIDSNLLHAKAYVQFIEEQQQQRLWEDASKDKQHNLPLWLSNPLAGGLLTNRHEGEEVPYYPWEFSRAGYRSRVDWDRAKSNLKLWRRRLQQRQQLATEKYNDDVSRRKTTIYHATSTREQSLRGKPLKRKPTTPEQVAWDDYQKRVLSAMTDMSRNYRVSVAAVALRWALQLNQVGSTVVGCNMMQDNDGSKSRSKKSRAAHLRDVFRFALKEEDAEALWKISSIDPPRRHDRSEDDDNYPQLDIRELMGKRSLWL